MAYDDRDPRPMPVRSKRRDYGDDDPDDDNGPSPVSRSGRDDRERPSTRPSRDDYDRSSKGTSRGDDNDRSSRHGSDHSGPRTKRRTGSDASDQSVYGQYVRHRDGRVEYISNDGPSPRRAPTARRSADELSAADRRRGRGPTDDEAERRRGGSDGADKAPRRRRPGYPESDDYMPPGSRMAPRDAPRRPAAVRRHDYDDDDDDDPRPARRAAPPSSARRAALVKPHDDDDDGYYDAPRQRRDWRRGSGGHYDDLGYDSERPRGSRRNYAEPTNARRIPRRYDDDYDDVDDGYYPRDRRSGGGGGNGADLRRTRSDRRPGGRSTRDRRGGSGQNDWKKQGLEIFNTTAMPLIKAEGGKFVKKQLESFLASQGR